ncbi:MAG: hypothetical protein F6K14_26880 [Symploca sp. SIO2C1]|nr:hypothetical protein [Symploca sp. SIO2C1]
MDRDTKQKLKRIWFLRSLLGLAMLVTLGFCVRQVQAVRTHTAMQRQVLEWLRKHQQKLNCQRVQLL